MIKHLTKKGYTFWYRRRLGRKGEIVFSLGTKNYDLAILRHSYIDYKINQLILKGAIETMNTAKIREIIDGYKEFVKSDDFIYGDEGDARNEALAIEIDGEFFGGHTKTALMNKLSQYGKVSQSDDISKVKEHTEPIIERSAMLKKEYEKLDTEKEQNYFHWKVLKAEVWALNKAIKQQEKNFGAVEQHNQVVIPTSTTIPKSSISISELTKRYIDEVSKTKEWTPGNEDDINDSLGLLNDYFSTKTADELVRKDFVHFRDDVLSKLPSRRKQNAFKGKTIHEIIGMTHIPPKKNSKEKPKKILRIAKPTINNHIGRVSQVFAWAANNAKIIEHNYASNLRFAKPQSSKDKKTSKLPFSTEELKRCFEESPHFTSDIKTTLINNPEYVMIPLIALYLGARNAEFTQLHYKDIKEINGIWCIQINDFIEDAQERQKRIKNRNSQRTVPIAKGLIDLGFLKYVKKRKGKLLFPNVTYSARNEPIFTNRINEYIRDYVREGDVKKTFLSFRHLVNQKLKNKETPVYIINDISGHSDMDHGENPIDVKVYGAEQMPLSHLKKTVDNCLVYNEIDFSHIKKAIDELY